jgi:hypothetical protein
LRRDDLEAILASASASARVVFQLEAFTGLRPCEIRVLRWSDVDLKVALESEQQLAGHAALTTTQLYADLDANDLRRAIERIDGGSAPVARHGSGLGNGGGP